MTLKPIPHMFSYDDEWIHEEFSCVYVYNMRSSQHFDGLFRCNTEHIFKWGYWYEQTEMDWHKIPEFLWSQAKWVALCEPVLFLENPCIKARSYLTNQNNVSTQITIIKWHDIVVEIEICGWICPGWVDLQASTERKGTNLEQVWC